VASGLFAFAAVAAVLVLTPGPDSMLVLGRAVRQGRTSALAAGLGVVVGLLVWGAASAVGLAAFVLSSHSLYDAVRVVGSLYLMWIGVQHVRASRRSHDVVVDATRPSFSAGLVTNLLNPKIALFYVSVLPRFAPETGSRLLAICALAGVHIVLSLAWLSGLAVAGSRAAHGLRPALQGRLEAIGGYVLVALGLRLALIRD
jgi:threonine/homoserine/homoserine lactone efflux protein